MPCYTPLKAFQITGKYNQKLNGKKTIKFKRPLETTYKNIDIPCGQCIGCRLTYSIHWATRLMHELQTTEDNKSCFITLTYNDKNIPDDQSLNKEHFKDFIKKFRKAIEPIKIRYFMAGEYGDITWRPHYHAIIFGYDFTETTKYHKKLQEPRQKLQYVETENPYYISELLLKLWTYGDHIITNTNFETCAYVARYIVKKINGEKAEGHYNKIIIDWNEFTGEINYFKEVDLQPEYATMSRGGKDSKNKILKGIGSLWYDKYKSDCFPSGYLTREGNKIPVPKYYYNKLESENPFLFSQMKIKKELAIIAHAQDLTPERLIQRHKCKQAQYKTLSRSKQ